MKGGRGRENRGKEVSGGGGWKRVREAEGGMKEGSSGREIRGAVKFQSLVS